MELGGYLPFWNELTAQQQTQLSAAVRERQYKKGETLHRGADDCIGLLLPVRGLLRVYMLSDEGRELTLYRLFERDMCLLSASCILPGIAFDVFVEAEKDTTVLHIPADVYRPLMEASAAVANYTNALMAAHMSDVMWLMDQVLNKKMDSRLAAFLVEESALAGSAHLTVTHERLARHLGSVREVITRLLRYFQAEGLVRLERGGMQLLDSARLREIAAASLR